MSDSKRGGARPGAGRPKLKVVKVPAKPGVKWLPFSVHDTFWQEFCDAASGTVQHLGDAATEADYERLAELVLVDAMRRYINGKKRASSK